MDTLLHELQALKDRIAPILVRLDIAGKELEIARLEAQASDPGFWNDQREAQQLMRRLSTLKQTVETWRALESGVNDAIELVALSGDDETLAGDLAAEVERLQGQVEDLEFQLSFSGPYDDRNAILAIHAGAGGTESQDWAEMLMRAFLRWAERKGLATEILDMSEGEEAGIKSVTIEITGPHAFGWLRSERGVHRLVRISPFDGSHARHTSFALVEVMPEAEAAGEVEVNPDDLRVDVYKASGHGGQNVQKNSTAIRITHMPTGIVVTCQNERSQGRNREAAMKVLESRLLEMELEKRAEEHARIKGDHVSAGWSNQIRSYVLHPYKLVKDHRTDAESTNPDAVLDGDLDPFMTAYLKSTIEAS
ncbi:MAG: peptide chain release factor 2 [Dehalococcoidia bacterium]|nr:peptide chain release factor 2 [Dehalococcoidia bacterium]